MIYMGIDPAIKKPHAYSIWEDNKVIRVGKFSYMCELWSILHKWNIDLVLLEDQYLAISYNTAKHMTFRSGMIAGICEYLSVNLEVVNVATWTSRLKIYKDIEKGLSVYKRKKEKFKRLIKYASQFSEILDEDIASAVLIPYAMKIKEKI